jgi:hypothetical protein
VAQPIVLTEGTRGAMNPAMPNTIRSGRVRPGCHVRLGFVLLTAAVGILFVSGTAFAAQSPTPADCHVTPCLLLGRAGGDTYVFTAWKSGSSQKISSIDLTAWTAGCPTDVRSSSGRCTAPVGPGRYSLTVFYYNITCTIRPAGREIQICFDDKAGMESHSSTAEYLQNGIVEAYAVQSTPAVARCP